MASPQGDPQVVPTHVSHSGGRPAGLALRTPERAADQGLPGASVLLDRTRSSPRALRDTP